MIMALAVLAVVSRSPTGLGGSSSTQLLFQGIVHRLFPAAAAATAVSVATETKIIAQLAKKSLDDAAATTMERMSNITVLSNAVQMFSSFLIAQHSALHAYWKQSNRGIQEYGIVIAAGHPWTLANAFVNLHVIRHTVGCRLPVTIM